MFRTVQVDMQAPSTNPGDIGANVRPQTISDPTTGDRIALDGSFAVDSSPVPGSLLGDPVYGVAVSSTQNDSPTDIFGGIVYGNPVSYDPGRPVVSFPLDKRPDTIVRQDTRVGAAGILNEYIDVGIGADDYALGLPPKTVLSRFSRMPAEQSLVAAGWGQQDGVYGGRKLNLEPSVATPVMFDAPVHNPLPSGTGGSFADDPGYTWTPTLSFRTPAQPWDTGYGSD